MKIWELLEVGEDMPIGGMTPGESAPMASLTPAASTVAGASPTPAGTMPATASPTSASSGQTAPPTDASTQMAGSYNPFSKEFWTNPPTSGTQPSQSSGVTPLAKSLGNAMPGYGYINRTLQGVGDRIKNSR